MNHTVPEWVPFYFNGHTEELSWERPIPLGGTFAGKRKVIVLNESDLAGAGEGGEGGEEGGGEGRGKEGGGDVSGQATEEGRQLAALEYNVTRLEDRWMAAQAVDMDVQLISTDPPMVKATVGPVIGKVRVFNVGGGREGGREGGMEGGREGGGAWGVVLTSS